MNRWWLSIALIASLWSLSGLVRAEASLVCEPGRPSESPVIQVALNHAPPYRIIDDQGVRGFYVEIFEALLSRLGWQRRYVEAPFARSLRLLEEGEVDVMLGPMPTPERERFALFALPAFPAERKVFLAHRPERQVLAYSDLHQRRVGVLIGSAYAEDFDRDAAIQREGGTDYANLLRMLEADRIDTVVIPELLGSWLTRDLGLTLTTSPYMIAGQPSHIAVSRRSQPMLQALPRVQACLEALMASPEYRQIIARYRSG